jgi:hypothetical protein
MPHLRTAAANGELKTATIEARADDAVAQLRRCSD